jgi:hypothetical protein
VAGFVVTGLLGIVLVWLSLRAWRLGRLELPIGESSLQLLRGSLSYTLALVLLFASGVSLLALAAMDGREAFAPDSKQLRNFDGDGFRIGIPEQWDPAPELIDEAMQQAGFAGIAFARRDKELVVMWPASAPPMPLDDASPAGVAAVLTALAASMRSPVIRYRQWDVTAKPRHVDIRMRYPAPRGEVIGRILAVVDTQHRLRSFQAVCSHDSTDGSCERIIDSLELTLSAEALLEVGTLPADASSNDAAPSAADASAEP